MSTNEIAMAEDRDLDFTQSVRRRIIEEIIPTTGKVANDPDLLRLALQASDGMDRQNLSKRKLRNDSESAGEDRQAQLAAAMILSRNPNYGKGSVEPVPNRTVPNHPQTLYAELVLAEGETTLGISDHTYDTFIRVNPIGGDSEESVARMIEEDDIDMTLFDVAP